MVYQLAGKRIKALRLKRNLTQKQFAELINSTQNYISEVETGKKRPSFDFYVDIANFFNVSFDYLFSGSLYDVKDNDIINNVVAKMRRMDKADQDLILKMVEGVEEYLQRK